MFMLISKAQFIDYDLHVTIMDAHINHGTSSYGSIDILWRLCVVLVLKLEVTEQSKRIASSPTSAPSPDNNETWDFELQRKIEMDILEEIEKLEERICSASLQTKVYQLKFKFFRFSSCWCMMGNCMGCGTR